MSNTHQATERAVGARAAQPSFSGMRLTRRGRVVLGALAVALVSAPVAGFMFNAAQPAEAVSEVSSADYGYIVPGVGDTLWSIAERLDSSVDPRDLIDELIRFNQLESASIEAYEPLAVPARFLGLPEVVSAAELGL